MMKVSRFRWIALGFAFQAALALAQGYPAKPVRVVVPFAPGGTVDTVARAFGQKFSEAWGQPMVIDNRAGAGGNIGADAVAKAAPDGYTFLLTTHGHAISPGLYRKLPFDALRDFAPVSQLTSSFLLLVASPKLPATLKEIIALAKTQPGRLNYGSTGPGAPPHLAGEMLKTMADIAIVHVPYKGDAPLMPALIAGEVQLAFVPLPAGMPHVKAGKLRAVAMTGVKRLATIPEVPTVTEAGVPGFEMVGWLGYFAPAATPRDIVAKISADAARIVRSPEIAEKLPGWGYQPVGSSPEEFAAKYRDDVARYTQVIRQAAIPLVE